MSRVQYQFRKLRPRREQPEGDIQTTLVILAIVGAIFGFPFLISFYSSLPSNEVSQTAQLVVFYLVMVMSLMVVGPFIHVGVDMRMNIRKLKAVLFGHRQPAVHRLSTELPVLLPKAWDVIHEGLSGLPIKMPDKRLAFWRVEKITEQTREIQATIGYMPDPLGRKMRDLYTRNVTMKLRLRGMGVRTIVEMHLEASSPMDDAAVRQLCRFTADALAVMCINAKSDESRSAPVADLTLPVPLSNLSDVYKFHDASV